MIISDYMSKNPVCISLDRSVTEAKAIMTREKINKLPVLDKDSNLVGIITKNDLAKAAPSAATTLDIYEMGYLLSKLKVEKVMTKNPVTVSPDEVIEEAARIMEDKDIGCLSVVQDGILVGIITESDIFKQFISMFGARHHGVRVTMEFPDRTGALADFARKIADKGGNIIAVVTDDGSNMTSKKVTVKIANLDTKDVESIISEIGVEKLDIREL